MENNQENRILGEEKISKLLLKFSVPCVTGADGSPTFAMIAMLTGAIINIILDPIFIFLYKWGIAGAAWATAIGQAASFVICAVYFVKPKNFKLTWHSFIPNLPILRNTIGLGAATFVTQVSIVVLSLVCNMTLAHYGQLSKYGSDIAISVFSIQTKVYTVVGNIVTGIVLGGQPIFGYNYGARRLERVRETYKIVLKSTLVVGIVATLIFEICPEVVIGIFGSGDALYQEFAMKTFRIYLSLMTITCLVKMTAVFFQSIGKSVRAVVASLIRDIVCFTPLAILLPHFLEQSEACTGILGILYAAPLADLVAVVVILGLTIPFFKNLDKEVYGDTQEEAAFSAKHSDEARAAYYRNISGQNWGEPHNYDLCIDASAGRERCAEIIGSYYSL